LAFEPEDELKIIYIAGRLPENPQPSALGNYHTFACYKRVRSLLSPRQSVSEIYRIKEE